MAKRKDSYYESGKRTGAWLKYKVNRCEDFIVGGNLPERKRTVWALPVNRWGIVWLKPELVAQVEYTEFTIDGHLRRDSAVSANPWNIGQIVL